MKNFSLRISKKNEWLMDFIKKEMQATNRPSINNTIEAILVDYFKNHKK